MPGLLVQVRDFASGPSNETTGITISKRRFLKFAVSTGSPIYAATIGGSRLPVAFASYKALAAKSSIDFTRADLELAVGYRNLEPTEKANLSYWTGMTFASLLADHFLKIPRLLHASSYAGLVRRDPSSKVLADLIGQDPTGGWHVLEAKARESVRTKGRDAWKRQAMSIASINANSPVTQSYALARIGRVLRAELVDPSSDDTHGIELELSEAEFLDTYYRPIRRWVSEGTRITREGHEMRVRLAAFDAADSEFVWIGLAASRISQELEGQAGGDLEFEDVYLGTDGIVVATSREQELQP